MKAVEKKKANVKEKILNHLLWCGRKPVTEKIFKKSLKEMQKTSKKQVKEIVLRAICFTAPLLKVLVFRQKKRKKKKYARCP